MSGGAKSLFESLSSAGQELVPVHFRPAGPPPADGAVATPQDPEDTGQAVFAASRFHRSRGYLCYDFHKPISKCFRARR